MGIFGFDFDWLGLCVVIVVNDILYFDDLGLGLGVVCCVLVVYCKGVKGFYWGLFLLVCVCLVCVGCV